MGYTYTLRDSGHRSQMVEQDGRTVDYSYDALYRLTEESISADPVGLNGTVMFSHDKVGNRLTRISTVTNLDSQNFTYDANDRLDSDTYDANGNTLGSQISAFAPYEDEYDFENRLVKRTYATGKTSTLAYDADGNRIQKTILNSQFSMPNSYFYLVDRNNPTGYAQVVEELRDDSTGSLEVYRTYTYGLDLIAQHQLHHEEAPTEWKTSYYLYDGLGTVRALADENGAITDTYTYSAFGEMLNSISNFTSPTANLYLFTGEQYDSDLEMYFLRARYMDPSKGRFYNMDTFEGRSQDPITLHKYLYANANPVTYTDPSGYFSLAELGTAIGVATRLLHITAIGTTIVQTVVDVAIYHAVYKPLLDSLRIGMLDPDGILTPFELGVFEKHHIKVQEKALIFIMKTLIKSSVLVKPIVPVTVVGVTTLAVDGFEWQHLIPGIGTYLQIRDFVSYAKVLRQDFASIGAPIDPPKGNMNLIEMFSYARSTARIVTNTYIHLSEQRRQN